MHHSGTTMRRHNSSTVGENVILGGDFNITLAERDSHRRQRTDAEKRIAENINEKIAITNLTDEFIGHNGYT